MPATLRALLNVVLLLPLASANGVYEKGSDVVLYANKVRQRCSLAGSILRATALAACGAVYDAFLDYGCRARRWVRLRTQTRCTTSTLCRTALQRSSSIEGRTLAH